VQGLQGVAQRGGVEAAMQYMAKNAALLQPLLKSPEGRTALAVAAHFFVVGFAAGSKWQDVMAMAAALKVIADKKLPPTALLREVDQLVRARSNLTLPRPGSGGNPGGNEAVQPLVTSILKTQERLSTALVLKAATPHADDALDQEISALRTKLADLQGKLPSGSGNAGAAAAALQGYDAAFNQAYGPYLATDGRRTDTAARTKVMPWADFDAFIDQRQPQGAGANGVNRSTAGFLDPRTKMIYIRGDAQGNLLPIGKDTYLHEKTHDMTSPSFIQQMKQHFGRLGGMAASGFDYLNEGITQMYTTRLSGIDHSKSTYGPRVAYAQRIEGIVGAETLKRAFFSGDPAALQAVKAAVDSLRKTGR
jgi:hypothetical protein